MATYRFAIIHIVIALCTITVSPKRILYAYDIGVYESPASTDGYSNATVRNAWQDRAYLNALGQVRNASKTYSPLPPHWSVELEIEFLILYRWETQIASLAVDTAPLFSSSY